MFTVEMDHDETVVTILDDVGVRGDVSFFFYEDMIYIRQFDEKKQKYDIILMSPEMWEEFMIIDVGRINLFLMWEELVRGQSRPNPPGAARLRARGRQVPRRPR